MFDRLVTLNSNYPEVTNTFGIDALSISEKESFRYPIGMF
jgi:hypothetical protein